MLRSTEHHLLCLGLLEYVRCCPWLCFFMWLRCQNSVVLVLLSECLLSVMLQEELLWSYHIWCDSTDAVYAEYFFPGFTSCQMTNFWRSCPRPKILLLCSHTCANALRTSHRFVLPVVPLQFALFINSGGIIPVQHVNENYFWFTASIPVRFADHTYVFWWGRGGEALHSSVAYWKRRGLAQACRDRHERYVEGQHWALTQSLPWGLWLCVLCSSVTCLYNCVWKLIDFFQLL